MDSCPLHGYRYYDGICSICDGTSNMLDDGLCYRCNKLKWHQGPCEDEQPTMSDAFSLKTFLAEVEDSCTNHAERKGYTTVPGADSGDVCGQVLMLLGVAQSHAIGEIVTKIIEYKAAPRRVLAVKIAGWAWRLWVNTEK